MHFNPVPPRGLLGILGIPGGSRGLMASSLDFLGAPGDSVDVLGTRGGSVGHISRYAAMRRDGTPKHLNIHRVDCTYYLTWRRASDPRWPR